MEKVHVYKVLLILFLTTTLSCGTDETLEATLPGEWVEVEPVQDRTILVFSSGNKLKRIDGEGNEEDYIYQIEGDSILLSLESGQEGSTELYFKKLDPGRFRIGNLYPSIPESEEVHMVFERN